MPNKQPTTGNAKRVLIEQGKVQKLAQPAKPWPIKKQKNWETLRVLIEQAKAQKHAQLAKGWLINKQKC